MHNKIGVIIIIISLCFCNYVFAQDKISLEDKAIGLTFKILAKAFITTVDFNKFKKENIDKINKMDEEKFKKRYAKAYLVIKDLPSNIKNQYKIYESMDKKQAIINIGLLDKKKAYGIIDSIPDTLISEQFKLYLDKRKQKIQNSNVIQQVKKFWDKIMNKAEAK